MKKVKKQINPLLEIPGIGKSISKDLNDIGIFQVKDLCNQNPEKLYELSNKFNGKIQDRCLLYTFRCAVYYAKTNPENRKPELLKWWNWMDDNMPQKY